MARYEVFHCNIFKKSTPRPLTRALLLAAISQEKFNHVYPYLSKLAQLPDTTQIDCAHKYTLDNICFAKVVKSENSDLLAREVNDRATRAKYDPTVPSSLALDKRTNPFLRSHEPSVIQAAQHHAGRPLAEPWQVFATVRAWKDALD